MIDEKIQNWRPGILTRDQLGYLAKHEYISDCKDVDYSSIDLHLAKDCYQMKGSLRLAKGVSFAKISDKKDYVEEHFQITDGIQLSPRTTYIIKLQESFQKNNGLKIYGKATGKSSIGRLDILTRLLAEEVEHYDYVPPNYNNVLYVEVTPITFPIIVKEGDTLNQLRLFRGDPQFSLIDNKDVLDLYTGLTTADVNPCDLHLNIEPIKIHENNVIAYKAITANNNNEAIKISAEKETYDPAKYWTPEFPNNQKYIKIEKEKFYILRSKERFKLPEDVGVYCQAITENLGEIRIHYAGFVHPGFGLYRNDNAGTPLIFEVRGHTVDSFLRDGELMAKISFFRTSEHVNFTNDDINKMKNDPYNNQELRLSNYFKTWEQ